MKRPFVALLSLISIALAIAVFLPAVRPVQAGGGQKAEAPEVTDGSNAADYCVKKGGEVNDRQPFYNTNDVEQNWLRLSGSTQFCKFLSK